MIEDVVYAGLLQTQVGGGTIIDWATTIGNLSTPALLIIIAWLGWSKKWIWGHHYEEMMARVLEMRRERDEYKDMLFRALKTAEAAVGRKEPHDGT